jgi:multidrug efflux pump subunit AcrA (membrane-fusion protein)
MVTKSMFLLLMCTSPVFGAGDDHSSHEGHDHSSHEGHDHSGESSEKRVPIPDAVKRNLGLVFAKAEYRSVASTTTLTGHFELKPAGQYHYPLPLEGRVMIMVKPLQNVKVGQLLAEIDSPTWRNLQQSLTEAKSSLELAKAGVLKAEAALKAAGEIQGVKDESNVYKADRNVAISQVNAAKTNLEQLILQASTLTGIPAAELSKKKGDAPQWSTIQRVPIKAISDGVVQEVDTSSNTWVEKGAEIIHIVDPKQLRFKGVALQSDVYDDLRNDQLAVITPPTGPGERRTNQSIRGKIRIGLTGNPEIRTIDVFIDMQENTFPSWVKPEMSAVAKVVTSGSVDDEELSIPTRAIIQDGLDTVYFLVDPKSKNSVIRKVADMGPTDGKWTTIYSGLAEDDEVVVDGVYQLKLATSAQATKGGHFEADGTWHEGGEH